MRSLIALLAFLFFLSLPSIFGFEIYGGNDADDFDVSRFALGIDNRGIHSLSNRINGGAESMGDGSMTLLINEKMTPEQEAVLTMLEEQNREWMALSATGGACATPGMCRNGGNCTNVGSSYQCLCPPQWTGSQCEIAVASSSSSAIIAPTGLTSHLSSALSTAITGSLTTSLSSGITAPPTPPPSPPISPSIVEGATGLAAGNIAIVTTRNGNSGYYILGAIATSMSVGFVVYVTAKRDADIDDSDSFAHLRPRKYQTPSKKKKTAADTEEKKFADEEQGGAGKIPSADDGGQDVIVDTTAAEAKEDIPDPAAYTYVMDFKSVFALKNNVLDQKVTTGPVGETVAAPIDPQSDVHFVLHE